MTNWLLVSIFRGFWSIQLFTYKSSRLCRVSHVWGKVTYMENTISSPFKEIITLGGGCFWCLDAVYARVRGVNSVDSGYSNGHVLNPSYQDVCGGDTGHNEVVQLTFDPTSITLTEILEIFFLVHDATTLNAQGNDVGTQYRSGIYFGAPAQEKTAKTFIAQLAQDKVFSRPIVTEVLPLQNYSKAEDYHQDFFAKNPNQGYCVAVAGPKVAKLRKTFADRVKS